MNKTVVWQTASPRSSHPLPPQISLWRRWRNNTRTPAPHNRWCFKEPTCSHTPIFNPPLDRPNNSVLHKSTEEVPNWPKETGRSSIPHWKRPFIFMFLAEIWWVDTENRTVLFGAVLVPCGSSEGIYVGKAALLSCPPSGQKHWQTLRAQPQTKRNHVVDPPSTPTFVLFKTHIFTKIIPIFFYCFISTPPYKRLSWLLNSHVTTKIH